MTFYESINCEKAKFWVLHFEILTLGFCLKALSISSATSMEHIRDKIIFLPFILYTLSMSKIENCFLLN
jgi:hypothetical protein